ncbi:MAG: CPBP family intramembrane metalloprotease [Firmicutes bacterium]|nr:CPBP family intramembrane metalloprotease [Bacillota bacterium]
MKKYSSAISVTATVIAACAVMAVVDGVWKPGYLVKSLIKFALFVGIPAAYAIVSKQKRLWTRRLTLKQSVLFPIAGAAVCALIIGTYFALENVIDLSAVTGKMAEDAGVNRGNYIFVAFYIALCNSLLEEFFFRGYAFLHMKTLVSPRYAYFFSAAAFSLYHGAMLAGWFSWILFALVLAALAAAGLLFEWIDEKFESIIPSWTVHMFANLAINIIGYILLQKS